MIKYYFADRGKCPKIEGMKHTPATTNPTPKALALLAGSPAERVLARWLGGKAETTRAAYSRDLDHFARWAHREGYAPAPEQVVALDALIALGKGGANAVALEWLEAMEAVTLAPRTINRRLAALKSAVAMACDVLDLIPWRLTIQGVKVGRPVKDTRGAGEESVGRVLRWAHEQAETGKPKAVRDWAILLLLAGHGLRRVEVLRLTLADVDLIGSRLWIQGKGQNEREAMSLVPESLEAVAAWIKLRGDHEGALFASVDRHGNIGKTGLGPDGVAGVTKGAAKACGERHRYNPHSLRHAAITRAARVTGGNIAQVSAFSRHKDLRTVKVYLDDVADDQGRAAAAVIGGWAV